MAKAQIPLRKIPSSPNDDYRAGADGRIYSRTHYAGFGRKEFVDWYPLAGHQQKGKGYRVVSMCHQNIKVTKSVHRLICEAFHGPPPTAKHQVRHLDGDPKNNRPENLRWGSQVENWLDRKAHGRGCEGEKHPMAKLTNAEAAHLQWAIKKGLCSQHHAARMLGMSRGGISHVVHGRKE